MSRLLLALIVVTAAGAGTEATTHKHATDARAVVAPPLQSREPELRPTRSFRRPPLAGRRRADLDPVRTHGQQRWHNWAALSLCESGGNPRTNTGNGFYGAYQFDAQTWVSVGGHGLPSDASLTEQTYRAQLLYARRGAQPWPACGHHLQDAA